jgi:hypothetical protein
MARVILLLAAVGVTIYAVIDCWQRDERTVRALPKALWFAVIIFLPLVGGLLWLTLGRGRPLGGDYGDGIRVPRHSSAPDDDEAFLRSLDERRRRPGPDDHPDPT